MIAMTLLLDIRRERAVACDLRLLFHMSDRVSTVPGDRHPRVQRDHSENCAAVGVETQSPCGDSQSKRHTAYKIALRLDLNLP
jgi:hypothetical protein